MFAHVGLEALLVSLAILLALLCPRLGERWFERAERALANVARRPVLSILLCGFSALVLRLLFLPWLPVPTPYINDEFSFLLAGDTFAHGRLANASHPMWLHFETFHVIFHPTYASMYPPLQGVILAAGQVFGQQPFWGVWLSVGLMCATFCWMLQAWLPPSWALLGGMLPVIRFGVLSYWDNSYWGGALAATGGALLLGALPRILKHQRTRDSLLLAFGIAILANTRPYEGMMLTLVVGTGLAVWVIRDKPAMRPLLRRVALPAILVLAVAGSATGYYFWGVTGNPLTMPQQVNRNTYATARYFYWQTANAEPVYHHKAIRDFYHVELSEFNSAHSVAGLLVQWMKMAGRAWIFFISPLLTLPLLFLPRIVRDRRVRFLVVAGAVGLASSALVVFFNINYLAPIACVIVAVIIQGMRHLRVWHWEGKPTGRFLMRAIALICMVMVPVEAYILSATPLPGTWAAIGPERAAIDAQLRLLPGPQLVLVQYAPNHNPMLEWVYNGADIDHEKVVWARNMDAQQNNELLQYYNTRRAWLLEADAVPPRLSEYVVPGIQISAKDH
jgi:hypothetical protein